RSPQTIEEVAARTPVGNLYVNREITGAMVGRQPFGGGRLSGTGPKAGGPDYLLQFVEARAVCENTVRHGLVV
ncbi:MAG: RHH-type transcriptional regulator, proline utilization regulon repressor / proline dehydrogenase, partial [Baekduia sp.]|nr:RHH-type transcriptional regulator, proline utilization regulon repressor / proline dehydrogenase [Baekduia sp.]